MESMKVSEILKEAKKESGVKQMELAEKLGVLQSNVSVAMNRPRVGADVLVGMLNAMGYSVVVGKDEWDEFVPIWKLEAK